MDKSRAGPPNAHSACTRPVLLHSSFPDPPLDPVPYPHRPLHRAADAHRRHPLPSQAVGANARPAASQAVGAGTQGPQLSGVAGAQTSPLPSQAVGAESTTKTGPVARARGIHPIPSRTRSLSPAARMVLPGSPGGRVRRRRPTPQPPLRLPTRRTGGFLRFTARGRHGW